VVFTGDAAKNRAELVSRDTDMTYDAAVSRASIDLIWGLWRKKPGSLLIPGHDLPMTQDNGRISYMGKREAAITTWYGDGMDQVTRFELTV
jgi:N-acyl homoserine lactone hydrolase